MLSGKFCKFIIWSVDFAVDSKSDPPKKLREYKTNGLPFGQINLRLFAEMKWMRVTLT